MRKESVSQDALIALFKNYITLEKRKNNQAIHFFQSLTMSVGLCNGFAMVHAFMHASNKLNWWESLLSELSLWNSKPDSLQKIITLPGENAGKPDSQKTLDYYFKQAIHFVVFCQALPFQNEISGLTQKNLFDPSKKWFDFIAGRTICFYECSAISFYSIDNMQHALDSRTYSQSDSLFFLTLSFRSFGLIANHICAMRYDVVRAMWFCYDPNYPDGEEFFSNVAVLFYTLGSRYHPIKFYTEIASFNADFQFYTPVMSKRNQLKSIRDELLCLKMHYSRQMTIQEPQGCWGDFFGIYSSLQKQLMAVNTVLSSVMSCLQDPEIIFDRNAFNSAQYTGKIGEVVKRLNRIFDESDHVLTQPLTI